MPSQLMMHCMCGTPSSLHISLVAVQQLLTGSIYMKWKAAHRQQMNNLYFYMVPRPMVLRKATGSVVEGI